MSRIIIRLRVLVLLPTRDLVLQVKQVFDQIAEGTNLKIAAIFGQTSFKQEQESLVPLNNFSGDSLVDILIATPGRLMDHLNGTKGFTLEHLQYLVITPISCVIPSY